MRGLIDRVSVGLVSFGCNVCYSETSVLLGKSKQFAFQVTQRTFTSDIGEKLLSDGQFEWSQHMVATYGQYHIHGPEKVHPF